MSYFPILGRRIQHCFFLLGSGGERKISTYDIHTLTVEKGPVPTKFASYTAIRLLDLIPRDEEI